MVDIAMCLNKTCEIKDRCYRYRAKPNDFRQSYGCFKPKRISGVVVCDNHIKFDGHENSKIPNVS